MQYNRFFIPLAAEARGYDYKGRQPAGRCILEERAGSGKLTCVVQDLKPEVSYALYLLFPETDRCAGVNMASLTADAKGKAETRREFDVFNILKSGRKLSDCAGVAVMAAKAAEPTAALLGGRDTDFRWRRGFYDAGAPPAEPAAETFYAPAPRAEKEWPSSLVPNDTYRKTEKETAEETNEIITDKKNTVVNAKENADSGYDGAVTAPQNNPAVNAKENSENVPAESIAENDEVAMDKPAPDCGYDLETETDPEPNPETKDKEKPKAEPKPRARIKPETNPSKPKAKPVAAKTPAPAANTAGECERESAAPLPPGELSRHFHDALQQMDQPQPAQENENWQLMDDKMAAIFENNEPLFPFKQQSRPVSWVRICPEDQVPPPQNMPGLFNEAFVRSAYDQYNHWILGTMLEMGRRQYVIGVPGLYAPSLRMPAARLGFTQFKCCEDIRNKTGEFGYWLMFINT